MDLQARIRAFIADEIIPLESDARRTPHGPDRRTASRADREGARRPVCSHRTWRGNTAAWRFHHVGRAIVFEEAGYSPLGPVALNVFAPDEGNMHLLEAVATPAQKERWLRPLAAGAIRSCFCMTEPPPGAGSDPSMLATTATRDGGDYVINGGKWFITGADGAAFAIIMAKVDDVGATMFLADMNAPGHRARALDGRASTDASPAATASCASTTCACRAEAVLGEVGEGFQYAQVRLSPARLTHCMRWLGAVRRAHDIAVDYARDAQAFGKRIGDHEGVGFMLADNEMDMHVARLAIWHCAWVLDRGELALHESSRAKVIASEAMWRVVDRCVQILGGQGVTARNDRRADLRRRARVSHLRRPVGSASLEHGAAHPSSRSARGAEADGNERR